MSNKLLPSPVRAALRKLSKRKHKPKVPMDEATRQKFVEWGRQGHRKAKAKLTKAVLKAAGKKGGNAHIRKVYESCGLKYPGVMP